ncbi:MAG: Beta-lactamase [Candidatus Eremiobacteraeota bacterium]|nr:Beta-lactamase [Candidatus Eremiobacteraeota bacterium]
MRIPRVFIAALTFALAPSLTAAGAAPSLTPPSNADVQALLDARVAHDAGTGIIVGIVDRGVTTILKAGSSGTARPLDERSLFEIGSVTKTFTATVLADMALRREVTLDEPVQRCLPGGTSVPSRHGKPITLLSLATQHSALPRMPDNMHPRKADDPYADYTFAQLAAFLKGYSLTRDPGAQFEYSNLGIGLLGDALADCAHTAYPRLVQARVFGPLGMRETSALPIGALTPVQSGLLVVGRTVDGTPAAPWNFDAIAPAGAIRSNVHDMLQYVRCNLGLGPLAKTCLYAQQPRSTFPGNQIGLVWWTGGLVPIVHHGGDTSGFHASVAISPDHQRGVVVLANGGDSVDVLAEHLVDAAIPVSKASTPDTFVMTASALDAYAGDYRARNVGYHIRRDGETLSAQLDGQSGARIYAKAKDRFFYKAVNAQLDFTRDAAGAINGVVLHQDGDTTVFTRDGMASPVITPAPEASMPPAVRLDDGILAQYVGTYLAGAGAAFTIARGGENGLTVQLTGQTAFPLYATSADHFFLKVVEARIDFTRDANHRIDTLVLHQGGRDIIATKQ